MTSQATPLRRAKGKAGEQGSNAEGCTWAVATAMTIFAPSLAMPPASYLRPTMKPCQDSRPPSPCQPASTAHSMSKRRNSPHHDVLQKQKWDLALCAELDKMGTCILRPSAQVSATSTTFQHGKTQVLEAHTREHCSQLFPSTGVAVQPSPLRADSEKRMPLLATTPTSRPNKRAKPVTSVLP
jgi:hypothetical protein